jgi:hypothetical protein
VRKVLLALAGVGLTAAIVVPSAAAGTAADEQHCYTLGAPGQPHYEYCTYLPVDPNDIFR